MINRCILAVCSFLVIVFGVNLMETGVSADATSTGLILSLIGCIGLITVCFEVYYKIEE